MAHPRQGIIFAQESHIGSALPVFPYSTEGCFQSPHSSGHGKSMVFQIIGQQAAGKDFMGSDFRMVENGIGHLRQFRSLFIYTGIGLGNLLFQHILSSSDSLYSSLFTLHSHRHMGPRWINWAMKAITQPVICQMTNNFHMKRIHRS